MTPTHVIKNKSGFTLVELMIAVFLSAIAAIAIYRGYTSFSQTADAQEQMIEMQQNLRIGMFHLEKHLRRAGMNEEDDENAGFRLDRAYNGASESSVSFTMDMGGTDSGTPDETWVSGDPGDGDLEDDDERLTFQLVAADLPTPVPPAPWTNVFNLVLTDENNDDALGNPLPLNNVIITNVDALNFVYLDEDNEDIDPQPRAFLGAADMDRIRSVQVTLVVRTTNEDYRYTNNEIYRNQQDSDGDGENDIIYTAPGDNFRRRLLTKEIKIRNAGL